MNLNQLNGDVVLVKVNGKMCTAIRQRLLLRLDCFRGLKPVVRGLRLDKNEELVMTTLPPASDSRIVRKSRSEN